MAPAGTAPMTAEDLFDRIDDGYRYELFEGELIRMTPTGGRHSAVAGRIARLIDEFAEARDLGICGAAEPGFILRRSPDDVRTPGVCFVAKARIPAKGIPTTYRPFAPDLAVEVISPSDRLVDVHVKITEYFAAGARLVWVVEPETRTVHVYRSRRDVQVIGIGDELDGDEVLPSFRCAVRRLFPEMGQNAHPDGFPSRVRHALQPAGR